MVINNFSGQTNQKSRFPSDICANLARLQCTIVMAPGVLVPSGNRSIPRVLCARHLGFLPERCIHVNLLCILFIAYVSWLSNYDEEYL